MMCCLHVANGFLLSRKIKTLPAIFTGCFGLHLFCDAIPHWNPGCNEPAFIADVILTLVAIGFLGNWSWRTLVIIFGSTLPDLVFLSEYFCFGQPRSLLTHLHGLIQIIKLDAGWGILVQIIFLMLMWRWTQVQAKSEMPIEINELSCERV